MKKKSQEEGIEKMRNRNNLIDNQEAQIKEVKKVLVAIQKKEAQTTPTPYIHPNYNHHFDQQQGQNEYSQKTYVDMRKY